MLKNSIKDQKKVHKVQIDTFNWMSQTCFVNYSSLMDQNKKNQFFVVPIEKIFLEREISNDDENHVVVPFIEKKCSISIQVTGGNWRVIWRES